MARSDGLGVPWTGMQAARPSPARVRGVRPVKGSVRRGLKASLLYLGTAKWRRVQPFTSQADDVARTIVTLWTKAGHFSFLAADLENGPILAPEYGFFVRRTTPLAPTSGQTLAGPACPTDAADQSDEGHRRQP